MALGKKAHKCVMLLLSFRVLSEEGEKQLSIDAIIQGSFFGVEKNPYFRDSRYITHQLSFEIIFSGNNVNHIFFIYNNIV